MKISILSRVCALMALAMLAVATADSANAGLFGGRLLGRFNDDCCQQASYGCEQTCCDAPVISNCGCETAAPAPCGGCEAAAPAPCGGCEAAAPAPCGGCEATCCEIDTCCGADTCCESNGIGDRLKGLFGGLRGNDCCDTEPTCCEGGRLSGILGDIQLDGCSTCNAGGCTSCGTSF